MTNRTFFFMTIIVLAAMAILLGINLTSILTGKPEKQTYLKYNDVRGMAVGYNHLLYTLNFAQQKQVISILNRSVKVMGVKPGKRERPAIEKMEIYLFEKRPTITITPIAYIDNNLVFTTPEWSEDGYLMEVSNGALKKLLTESYDP
jgi:hypothetical protein